MLITTTAAPGPAQYVAAAHLLSCKGLIQVKQLQCWWWWLSQHWWEGGWFESWQGCLKGWWDEAEWRLLDTQLLIQGHSVWDIAHVCRTAQHSIAREHEESLLGIQCH